MAAARKFQERVYSTSQRISLYPALGRQRDEILPGVRSFPVLAYLLFYEEHPTHVEIVRVLHQHRDLSEAFADARKQRGIH